MVHDERMAGTKEGALKRKQAQAAPQGPVYVVAPKRALMHEGKRLEAGEVIEGAHLWPRLESWINTGRIVRKT